MNLCWVITSTTAYHNARMAAVRKYSGSKPYLLQWTDTDEFAPLQAQNQSVEGFETLTLLPGRPVNSASPLERRRVLAGALGQVRPSVVCVNGWGMPASRDVLAWCVGHRVPPIMMSDSTIHDACRSGWREAIKR